MITNTFTNFARRLAATKGFPYVVIAETPNPSPLEEPAAPAR
jgi:hypothetical protein